MTSTTTTPTPAPQLVAGGPRTDEATEGETTTLAEPATREPVAARHLFHLDDIREVPTSRFKFAHAQLAETVEDNGVAAVYGRPGNGKTFTSTSSCATTSP